MRGLAVLLAAGAGWALAGAPVPTLPRPTLPKVPAHVWLLSTATAAVSFLLLLGLTAAPGIAAALALLAAAVPYWRAAAAAARRRSEVADAWPDLLVTLRSRIAAGAPLPDAFVAASTAAGGRLAEAGARIEAEIVAGARFADLAEELRTELADPISDRVLTTLVTAQRSGGQRVGSILGALGASVADELRLHKAHDAALTQQRLTAAVALVGPWALLVLTVTGNPQAAAAYRTPTGTAVIAGGLAATGAGYLLARRTARLSKPPRLFR